MHVEKTPTSTTDKRSVLGDWLLKGHHLRGMFLIYLDVSAGVDFVNGVSGGPTRLPVQIVALDKHGVVTQASHPHVALTLALKLDAFADVKPERGEQRGPGAEMNLFLV